eukprot:CAMPEP_0178921224 /NCGR_PEP_ID=MMETSP0786-20121207/15444_1 /TAXON_ID=186022 /ORGANISM="Thalassionema frauenfeldii, Strain CCMP 1798" /LENGTH=179 /DNA_ID=CAMNT_0020595383 /DNA_START=79 /DNA_END=618 /DNA_ORIENTATION=-
MTEKRQSSSLVQHARSSSGGASVAGSTRSKHSTKSAPAAGKLAFSGAKSTTTSAHYSVADGVGGASVRSTQTAKRGSSASSVRHPAASSASNRRPSSANYTHNRSSSSSTRSVPSNTRKRSSSSTPHSRRSNYNDDVSTLASKSVTFMDSGAEERQRRLALEKEVSALRKQMQDYKNYA